MQVLSIFVLTRKEKAMNFRKFITKYASTIFTGLAVVGVVATAVLTHKATIKAQKSIDEWTKEKHEELTTFEKVQASARHYVPPIVTGALTIVSVIKAQSLNKRDIARLAGVCGVVGGAYDEYRRTNIEVNGKEADERVMKSINAQKAAHSNIIAETFGTLYSLNSSIDTEERLFYDTITEQFFTSTLSRVIDAEYHLNRNFVSGHPDVDVQMWCDFLGIKNTAKDSRGWALVDDLTWLDFSNLEPMDVADGMNAIRIEPCVMPVERYWELDYDYEYE